MATFNRIKELAARVQKQTALMASAHVFVDIFACDSKKPKNSSHEAEVTDAWPAEAAEKKDQRKHK